MRRDEAVPGAIVVKVYRNGARMGTHVYRVTSTTAYHAMLSRWTGRHRSEGWPWYLDGLRIATVDEKRNAGLEVTNGR